MSGLFRGMKAGKTLLTVSYFEQLRWIHLHADSRKEHGRQESWRGRDSACDGSYEQHTGKRRLCWLCSEQVWIAGNVPVCSQRVRPKGENQPELLVERVMLTVSLKEHPCRPRHCRWPHRVSIGNRPLWHGKGVSVSRRVGESPVLSSRLCLSLIRIVGSSTRGNVQGVPISRSATQICLDLGDGSTSCKGVLLMLVLVLHYMCLEVLMLLRLVLTAPLCSHGLIVSCIVPSHCQVLKDVLTFNRGRRSRRRY